MKNDCGLSEIIGALILVALVITGIGIVGVLMFSTPPPQAKEKMVLSSSSMQCDEDSFIILTRHEGGDIVNPQKLRFYLTTEYYNKTLKNRFVVNATSFLPAEIYSQLDKGDLCDPDINKTHPYTQLNDTMRNGDVILIWYEMDPTSHN
jgi:hypothetical protein